MISNIQKFEKKLKIKMKDKLLLTKALTHKSANLETNNEKLEFIIFDCVEDNLQNMI